MFFGSQTVDGLGIETQVDTVFDREAWGIGDPAVDKVGEHIGVVDEHVIGQSHFFLVKEEEFSRALPHFFAGRLQQVVVLIVAGIVLDYLKAPRPIDVVGSVKQSY